jgi:hypothetical protein
VNNDIWRVFQVHHGKDFGCEVDIFDRVFDSGLGFGIENNKLRRMKGQVHIGEIDILSDILKLIDMLFFNIIKFHIALGDQIAGDPECKNVPLKVFIKQKF